SRGFKRIVSLIREVDPGAIYLNSYFDTTFTIPVLALRAIGFIKKIPIILAPRGEFSTGALKIKRSRKFVFISLTKLLGLYEDVLWQASSELEKRDIMAIMRGRIDSQSIIIAPNLTANPEVTSRTIL